MGTGSVRWGEHTTGYSRALSAGSWEAAAEWDVVFVAALKWKLKASVHIEMVHASLHTAWEEVLRYPQ